MAKKVVGILESAFSRLVMRLTDALVIGDGESYVVIEDLGTGITMYRRTTGECSSTDVDHVET